MKNQLSLKIGDIVSRSKGFAFRHVGLIIEENQIAHCVPVRGAIISTFEEFSDGEAIYYERSVSNVGLAIFNAQRLVQSGYKYYLINQNCEHFVTKCEAEKEPHSLQLSTAATILGVFGFLYIVFNKNK